jgi:hypothetical protein
MSEEKARAQSMKFQDLSAIIDVLNIAYDEGVRVFMCTTHDRIAEICDHVRANPTRYRGFELYPCMPYAHKYANAVTEFGPMDALKRLLPDEGAFGALMRSGLSLARKDVEGLAALLIDAEMKMFHDLKTPVIFLQNVVTDLILGVGANEAFRIFHDHVKQKYHAEPGFITMNLPKLLDALDSVGIANPIVCANINKIGFRMCGGIAAYEAAISTRRFRPVAMSVLASGSLSPREAIQYICDQPRIESIVFGASGRANIHQTVALIQELSVA